MAYKLNITEHADEESSLDGSNFLPFFQTGRTQMSFPNFLNNHTNAPKNLCEIL